MCLCTVLQNGVVGRCASSLQYQLPLKITSLQQCITENKQINVMADHFKKSSQTKTTTHFKNRSSAHIKAIQLNE